MEETLNAQINPQGVGLAANQVGLNLSIFLAKPDPDSPIEVVINPRILEISKQKASYKNKSKAARKRGKKSSLEGCLSIPRIWAPVQRAHKVRLEYQDIKGKKRKKWFTGFKAAIMQHEIDHLNGILFTQRALEQKTEMLEEKNGKLEKIEY